MSDKAKRFGRVLREEITTALADMERSGDTSSRTQIIVDDRPLSLSLMGDAATLRAVLGALKKDEV